MQTIQYSSEEEQVHAERIYKDVDNNRFDIPKVWVGKNHDMIG